MTDKIGDYMIKSKKNVGDIVNYSKGGKKYTAKVIKVEIKNGQPRYHLNNAGFVYHSDLDENKKTVLHHSQMEMKEEQKIKYKIGDIVHAGFGTKGGAGFIGKIYKIEDDYYHLNIGKPSGSKFGDRTVKAHKSKISDIKEETMNNEEFKRGTKRHRVLIGGQDSIGSGSQAFDNEADAKKYANSIRRKLDYKYKNHYSYYKPNVTIIKEEIGEEKEYIERPINTILNKVISKIINEGRGRPRKDGTPTAEEDPADNHIMMQLRKVITLRGQKPVKFMDGSSHHISAPHAYAALSKYTKLNGPDAKEKYVNKLAHSHGSFMNALNETAVEQGLQDHEPRYVIGVKGMKSKPFKKKFRNQEHMEKWMESDDYGNHEVHYIQKEEYTPEEYEAIAEDLLNESNQITTNPILGSSPLLNPLTRIRWHGYEDQRKGLGFRKEYETWKPNEQRNYERGRQHAALLHHITKGNTPKWDHYSKFTTVMKEKVPGYENGITFNDVNKIFIDRK